MLGGESVILYSKTQVLPMANRPGGRISSLNIFMVMNMLSSLSMVACQMAWSSLCRASLQLYGGLLRSYSGDQGLLYSELRIEMSASSLSSVDNEVAEKMRSSALDEGHAVAHRVLSLRSAREAMILLTFGC